VNYPAQRLTEGMFQAFQAYGYKPTELIRLIEDVEAFERKRILKELEEMVYTDEHGDKMISEYKHELVTRAIGENNDD
jgi:hypothetical protein